MTLGCTDPFADNYDPLATENGICSVTLRCVDPTACNCDPNYPPDYIHGVTGSGTICEYPDPDSGICSGGFPCQDDVWGCTNFAATNYTPGSNRDDGSCQFAQVGISSDDIIGCTDSTASNYNPDATAESGLCEYELEEEEGFPIWAWIVIAAVVLIIIFAIISATSGSKKKPIQMRRRRPR